MRSGVGTQMLMVSSSQNGRKIRGGPQFARFHQRRQRGARNIADIGIARVDPPRLFLADIDAGDREAGLGELHRQRQSDVSQADDADARAPRANLFGQNLPGGHGHSIECWLSHRACILA